MPLSLQALGIKIVVIQPIKQNPHDHKDQSQNDYYHDYDKIIVIYLHYKKVDGNTYI